jgi:hypothetical protein
MPSSYLLLRRDLADYPSTVRLEVVQLFEHHVQLFALGALHLDLACRFAR